MMFLTMPALVLRMRHEIFHINGKFFLHLDLFLSPKESSMQVVDRHEIGVLPESRWLFSLAFFRCLLL